MHPLLNGIPSAVTVDTKPFICVTGFTLLRILFGRDLVSRLPIEPMTLRLRWSLEMTGHARLFDIEDWLRAVVAKMTSFLVDLVPITKGLWIGMAGLAGNRRRLKNPGMHLVIVEIKGVFFLRLNLHRNQKQEA